MRHRRRGAGRAARARELAQAVERGLADAAGRRRHRAAEGHVVEGVHDEAEIRHDVLDLAPLVEPHAAHDQVGDARAAQGVFQDPGLGIRAVEDGDVSVVDALAAQAAHELGHEARFLVLVPGPVDGRLLALAVLRPEALVLPGFVVGDDVRRRSRGCAWSSDSSARARSPGNPGSPSRSRGCSGDRRRATGTPTGRGRRRRRGSGAPRSASGRCGTAPGSCPGTRRPGRSSRSSDTSRAPGEPSRAAGRPGARGRRNRRRPPRAGVPRRGGRARRCAPRAASARAAPRPRPTASGSSRG